MTGEVPDLLGGVDTFAGLPEWCVYVPSGWPDQRGAGFFAHLDYVDGSPRRCLVLDISSGGLADLTPIPIYLDRATLADALADWRARHR